MVGWRRPLLLSACLAALAGEAFAQSDRAESLRRRRTPVVEVFNSCKGAVVNISATQIVEVQDPFDDFDRLFRDAFDVPGFRQPRSYKATSVGSGFVIHPAGYIITNAHVVSQAAELKAIFADKRELDAEVVGADPENDLAVLKVKADRPLQEIKLGRSDDLMVGETAIAIGNPLGFQHTVTSGVISALDRTLEANARLKFTGLIQTDASINPGNSGGPLLNVLGELIGVNFAIRGDGQNIGFAIPVDRLTKQLSALLDVERRYRIETGFEISPGAESVVTRVVPGSPAAKAGLAVGDRVLALAGEPIAKGIDVHISLIGRKANERVPIIVQRDGQSLQTAVVLAGKPKPDGSALLAEKFGVSVDRLTPTLARRLGLRRADGIIVTKVDESAAAAEVIQPADILIQVDRTPLSNLDDLGLVLERVTSAQRVRMVFLRVRGQSLYRFSAAVPAR